MFNDVAIVYIFLRNRVFRLRNKKHPLTYRCNFSSPYSEKNVHKKRQFCEKFCENSQYRFNVKIHVQVHFTIASQFYVNVNVEFYIHMKVELFLHAFLHLYGDKKQVCLFYFWCQILGELMCVRGFWRQILVYTLLRGFINFSVDQQCSRAVQRWFSLNQHCSALAQNELGNRWKCFLYVWEGIGIM